MEDLQKEFEATGYASWINADLYPDGKIYAKEYTQWLERQVLALRQKPIIASPCCGSELINFRTYGYNECVECGKTYRQKTQI